MLNLRKLTENKQYRYSQACLELGLLPNSYNCYEILSKLKHLESQEKIDVWFLDEQKALGRWATSAGEFIFKWRD